LLLKQINEIRLSWVDEFLKSSKSENEMIVTG